MFLLFCREDTNFILNKPKNNPYIYDSTFFFYAIVSPFRIELVSARTPLLLPPYVHPLVSKALSTIRQIDDAQ